MMIFFQLGERNILSIVQVYFHSSLLMNGIQPYANSLVHVLRAEPCFQQKRTRHAHHK